MQVIGHAEVGNTHLLSVFSDVRQGAAGAVAGVVGVDMHILKNLHFFSFQICLKRDCFHNVRQKALQVKFMTKNFSRTLAKKPEWNYSIGDIFLTERAVPDTGRCEGEKLKILRFSLPAIPSPPGGNRA